MKRWVNLIEMRVVDPRSALRRRMALVPLGFLCGILACGPDLDLDLDLDLDTLESGWLHPQTQAMFALEARCEVDVLGTGLVDVENDYLPHVISCENGAADFEALKAQAVAARSYLYYRLATGDGSIRDGQADQVYTCANEPTAEHYQAVAETAGEVLVYRGEEVAAFYVAGAILSDRVTCVAAPGDNDYSGTEPYVTINWGFIDEGVQQTHLGWVNAANYANRGCKSQNGAHCLAESGWGYEDILIFYYGLDIEHVSAEGSCASPTLLPHTCGVVMDDDVDIRAFDDGSACFVSGCNDITRWEQVSLEDGVEAQWVPAASADAPYCFGRWRLSFAQAGSYEVDVYIPEGLPWVDTATYEIVHQGRSDMVSISQATQKGWVNLGIFDFGAGSFQYVELSNFVPGGAGTQATGVVFDQVRVRRPGSGTGVGQDGGTRNEKPIAGDAGMDGGPLDDDLPGVDSAGCGCNLAGGGRAHELLWWCALALFGVRRRWRPRASNPLSINTQVGSKAHPLRN